MSTYIALRVATANGHSMASILTFCVWPSFNEKKQQISLHKIVTT